MENLRLYEAEVDYTSEKDTHEYPTVSYCKENDTVYYTEKRPPYFIGTYNVTSTTRTTYLLGSNFDLSQIKEMYIDDVKQETVVSNYTFTTTGNHTVKCVMMDNVTLMNKMFSECSGLTSLDLSNFDTSNVTDMSDMFYKCSGLTSLDLSSFNTSNVTRMYNMFYGCSGLTSLDVSNFDTSNVYSMYGMFYNCYSLTSLDLSNFDTSKAKFMNQMFYDCSGLTSLDLSSFDTSNVTNMKDMFRNCDGLTSLDLSNFDTSNVTDMTRMFYDCSGLTSVTFGSQADVSSVMLLYNMFNGIATTGILYYPSAYADDWDNKILSQDIIPTTWTATAVDYENGETAPMLE